MAIKRGRKPSSTVHSVRVTDGLWAAARRRAEHEGVTINYVVGQILEGYAKGMLDLPKVTKTYSQPRTTITEQ